MNNAATTRPTSNRPIELRSARRPRPSSQQPPAGRPGPPGRYATHHRTDPTGARYSPAGRFGWPDHDRGRLGAARHPCQDRHPSVGQVCGKAGIAGHDRLPRVACRPSWVLPTPDNVVVDVGLVQTSEYPATCSRLSGSCTRPSETSRRLSPRAFPTLPRYVLVGVGRSR